MPSENQAVGMLIRLTLHAMPPHSESKSVQRMALSCTELHKSFAVECMVHGIPGNPSYPYDWFLFRFGGY